VPLYFITIHVFNRWYTLHNLHNGGAIALGLVSMYYNDDSVFNERIPILWSIGYFVVDLVDCGLRGDVAYSLHAAMCLFLGVSNYTSPISRALRMKYVPFTMVLYRIRVVVSASAVVTNYSHAH
jgi:hypothetical protein